VPAAPPPSVIRRHLLLALDELPATRSSLLKNFLWNEEVVRGTLDDLATEGKLTRSEVRFLDEGNLLRREHEYKSRRPPDGEQRPLDTVGARLIGVRDPAAGFETDEGVCMRVDPERLTIQAYPHRVFVHRGQRYRIRDWSALDPEAPGWIACDREEVHGSTWRIRKFEVFRMEAIDAPAGFGRKGRLLTRLAVALHYREEVTGALRLTPDLTGGTEPPPVTLGLSRPVARSFPTRALILRFPEPQSRVAIASVAQTFRHLLPVHLGVEDDAIEVVPLNGAPVQGQPVFGLAIVDLYPGGIGLIDAIGDDTSFLLQLFESGRDWLAACSCPNEQGCARCLRSPSAMAVNSNEPPLRSAALTLLRKVT